MQGGREKQQCAYWHEADAEPGIVLEVPEAAEEKSRGQQNHCGAQPERTNRSETDQLEPGANRRRDQNEVKQGAVSVREAKHIAPDGVVEQRGSAEANQTFDLGFQRRSTRRAISSPGGSTPRFPTESSAFENKSR
jgi:hypothetical protein